LKKSIKVGFPRRTYFREDEFDSDDYAITTDSKQVNTAKGKSVDSVNKNDPSPRLNAKILAERLVLKDSKQPRYNPNRVRFRFKKEDAKQLAFNYKGKLRYESLPVSGGYYGADIPERSAMEAIMNVDHSDNILLQFNDQGFKGTLHPGQHAISDADIKEKLLVVLSITEIEPVGTGSKPNNVTKHPTTGFVSNNQGDMPFAGLDPGNLSLMDELVSSTMSSNLKENSVVKKPEPYHDLINAKIVKFRGLINTPPDWVEALDNPIVRFLRSNITNISAVFVFRLELNAMLGFCEYIITLPEDAISKDMLNYISAPVSLSTYWGEAKGFGEGIVDWGKDIGFLIGMIGDIGKLPSVIKKSLESVRKNVNTGAIQAEADKAEEWMAEHSHLLIEFIGDVVKNPHQLDSLKDEVKNGMYKIAETMGGKLGEKFHQFTSQGTEKMGESIGEVIGYFIPDLLLVVFSEGISELIEGALKSVRVVLKGSEIGKLALEAVRVADVAVEALAKFVEKADIFLDTKYAELKEELLKIIELIKEWLGIEEEGAEAARMKKGPGAPKQPHEEMDHFSDGRTNYPGDGKPPASSVEKIGFGFINDVEKQKAIIGNEFIEHAGYTNGNAWDRKVLEMWDADGWEVSKQVRFKDPVSGKTAILDGIAKKGDEVVYLENKFGGAQLSSNQELIYPKIASGEAIAYGQNALKAFGEKLQYKSQKVLVNAVPK
jgi:hypothetical protein